MELTAWPFVDTRSGVLKKRKEESIRIRVTAEQKAALRRAADSAGVSVSSWMLMVALRDAQRRGISVERA